MRKESRLLALIVSVLVACTAQVFAQATTTQPASSFLEISKEQHERQQAEKAKANEAGKWDFNLDTRFQSQSVSPFGKLIWPKPVEQQEVTVWFPKVNGIPGRFYFDLWHSTNFDSTFDGEGADEVDASIGWKGEIWNGIGLNLWATYLDFQPIMKTPEKGDQVRFFAELDRKFQITKTQSLTPFVRFEVPWGLKGYKDDSGLRVYPGVKHNWEFVPNWAIYQKLNLCLDDGATGLQPAVIGDYKTGLTWKVNSWLTIEPINFRVVQPLNSISDGRETEMIVGAAVGIKF